MTPRLLTDDEIATQVSDLPGWERTEADGDAAITATYERDDFTGAIALVNAVAEVAEELDHHPDIDIRWNTVTFTLSTHSEGGLTQLDIEAAHRFAAAAG